MVKTPVPEWTKQILAPADKAEASGNMPEAELVEEANEDRETDVPQGVQDEVRELAAQEYAAAPAPPQEYEGTPEETGAHEGDLDHDPDGCDECVATEAAERATHPDVAEVPVEPAEEPKPPRTPRRYEVDLTAKPLKAFLAQVGALADEAKLAVGRDGIRAIVVDPAHVALVDVTLAGLEDFHERRDGRICAVEAPFVVGVDVEKLSGLLKQAAKDDIVHVRFDLPDPGDRDRITVSFGGLERTMPAIDTSEMAEPRVPTLNLPAKVGIEARNLFAAAKAAAEVSDHVRLTATRDGLNILAEGDTDTVSMDFRHGDHADVEIGGDQQKYSSLFPLDYLAAFLKVAKGEVLTLRLGTDYPLRADWEGATRGTYLLAPRIETS